MKNTTQNINLVYYKYNQGFGNFGDELSVFITQKLTNINKYRLVYNQKNDINLVCIGSFIHNAPDNSYIFGSGIRTDPPVEGQSKYKHLQVVCVRGPMTREVLLKKGIKCPAIYCDPALLLPKFYKPKLDIALTNKIGIVVHFRDKNDYSSLDPDKYHVISSISAWSQVVDQIYSCSSIISSSLHGLICSDAYHKPNIWLKTNLAEGTFKFRDYFASQERPLKFLNSISEISDLFKYTDTVYSDGNKIDIDTIIKLFPFS